MKTCYDISDDITDGDVVRSILCLQNFPLEIKISGYYADGGRCLLIGCHVGKEWSQSVAQQQVRRWTSRSHSRGQRAEVVGEFKWRVSLLRERNTIGQSQTEAVCVQQLWFVGFPGRHGDLPSLKLRLHL